ncbi:MULTISPECIES: 50S ribosomal protein L24 [Dehalococcoides]|jgi:large subunit ribosomal protein L24|uniref:Large ribosomal subunit protein uL24 n=4 Tax=Dehalococcoides mccartyi TaxID=61435 RepID=RL24_DEHMC|nr:MULTISPECIES: 50S ribosomal protein L24 [Dehalococcoides]A5FRX2.1 RecName: Full=Large ribosomal subunit protein uL24; AltName: Full=50S ribosomal protein L24 [Dehalococcoides mccartyi BAV1]Q3ZZL3.1 RecName: Full=Large ribosomal subunit protein uL24; AltName: Full=50S ribosomal protein L24 [Dehalococcoides mccartyi CBDB1]ACZ61583.1 ribosomal protein L24 [Dehalococcoides mccartyi VS]AGG06123.1 50S ribosomal protein L24 [Dehalococcoides mccartyi DCMB5]AGG07555.1 50S ribosomal protein L24 [Deha
MRLKKNDNVLVIAGKDKGKTGKVRYAYPRTDRVLVEGVNMIKRHSRAKGQAKQAGIIEREAPLHVSNLMLLCSKCNKPARIGSRELADGKSVRYCKSCNEVID